MKKIKAVFLDIDGTMVSFKTHAVSQQTKNTIKWLRSIGVKVFVATGRMLPMLTVLDGIEFDGYITYNGACCVDSTKENIIYKNSIPQKDIDALITRLEWDKFPVSFMCKNEMYVNYIDENVIKVAEIVGVGMPKLSDVKHIKNQDVFQVCIYVKDEKLNTILSETLTSCEGSRWIEYFADVNVIGLNKQSGIDRILEYFNIPLEQAMAFGDGGNDIPMLKHVPYGVAMGNASDAVKNAANYITSSVDEEGITKAIEYYKENQYFCK